jgi:hypothetical protein
MNLPLNMVAAPRGRITLDLADETSAVEVAQNLADATGCVVKVQDEDAVEIHAVRAATRQ